MVFRRQFCSVPSPRAVHFLTCKPSNPPRCKRSFDLSPFPPIRCPLFFTPCVSEGCARVLFSLLSVYYALFFPLKQSQPLSHQPLPHSFPCNGGWGVTFPSSIARLFNLTGNLPLAAFFCFQRLTHCPIYNPFVLMTLQQWGGRGVRPSLSFKYYFKSLP
jgi:hypothetical protein